MSYLFQPKFWLFSRVPPKVCWHRSAVSISREACHSSCVRNAKDAYAWPSLQFQRGRGCRDGVFVRDTDTDLFCVHILIVIFILNIYLEQNLVVLRIHKFRFTFIIIFLYYWEKYNRNVLFLFSGLISKVINNYSFIIAIAALSTQQIHMTDEINLYHIVIGERADIL